MDFENAYICYDEICEVLGVTKLTLNRWFIPDAKVGRKKFVTATCLWEFLMEYRDGKYACKLLEITQDDLDEMDEGKLAGISINKLLNSFRLYYIPDPTYGDYSMDDVDEYQVKIKCTSKWCVFR